MTTSFNLVISALFLVILVKTHYWTVDTLLDTTCSYPDYICSINKFNLFTLQWKPQLCFDNFITHPNCWKNDIPNITIHGIWQNYYTESYPKVPEHCTDAKLFDEHVEGITEQLDILWPSYRKDNNFEFWEHEWDKHGTCWNVNQSEYFQTGLKWIAQYDIENVLADNNIYPSICEYDNVIQDIICKQEYPINDVSNALDKVMNLRSVVWCSKDKKYIDEFIMCRDWYGTPINCPDNIVTDCGDMVALRSFIHRLYGTK
eukprot:202911_1